MLLFLAQLLILCGVMALIVAPTAFLVFGYRFAVLRRSRRGLLILTFFIGGALAAGFVLWHFLPAEWTLSFGSTLKATVDAKTYGHEIEHYAEGVVLMLTAGGLLGGLVGAGITAFLTRDKLAA